MLPLIVKLRKNRYLVIRMLIVLLLLWLFSIRETRDRTGANLNLAILQGKYEIPKGNNGYDLKLIELIKSVYN